MRGITDEEVARLGDGYGEARALFERIARHDECVASPTRGAAAR